MKTSLLTKLKQLRCNWLQVTINGIIAIIFIVLSIIFRNLIFLVLLAICLLAINYFLFSYSKKEQQNRCQLYEEEFVMVLNYVQTYLTNNFNVYNAFKETLPICSSWMQEKISCLLKDIDEDKSINPFIKLANNFSSKLIHQTIISLYLMIENGTNTDSIMRFAPIFNQLKEDILHNAIKRIENTYDTLNLLPVIGAGIITMTMILGIVGIVQGALYGI